ncbi:Uncharacterized protein TCM_044721 [Theobroma cacao]|uniref:RNase H type-1 domain-containing protein n=1 Tax=Theobroma cacao TaxID=3641 RepID=A0A061FRP0_THECC|nr:Uncharacterized protein TCM_044721 [Theobroma cacao]
MARSSTKLAFLMLTLLEKANIIFIKFNVDRAARGCPGLAEIRKALRDNNGYVIILFSKPLRVVNSNVVVITAIIKAFILFTTCPWAYSHELIVELDSSNVVKWCNDSSFATWRIRSTLNFINSLKHKILKWSVMHVPRSLNQLADCLAQEGVDRSIDILQTFN